MAAACIGHRIAGIRLQPSCARCEWPNSFQAMARTRPPLKQTRRKCRSSSASCRWDGKKRRQYWQQHHRFEELQREGQHHHHPLHHAIVVVIVDTLHVAVPQCPPSPTSLRYYWLDLLRQHTMIERTRVLPCCWRPRHLPHTTIVIIVNLVALILTTIMNDLSLFLRHRNQQHLDHLDIHRTCGHSQTLSRYKLRDLVVRSK